MVVLCMSRFIVLIIWVGLPFRIFLHIKLCRMWFFSHFDICFLAPTHRRPFSKMPPPPKESCECDIFWTDAWIAFKFDMMVFKIFHTIWHWWWIHFFRDFLIKVISGYFFDGQTGQYLMFNRQAYLSRDVLSEAVDCCIHCTRKNQRFSTWRSLREILTPRSEKGYNCFMTVRKMSWVCDLVAEMLLILKTIKIIQSNKILLF